MIFSSTLFLFFFFPVYFVVFYVLKKNIRIQNVWIILGSVLFYAYGAREFFLIVLGTLLIDYCLGLLIYKHKRFAKLFTALDVIINIGILAYFKYLNFFIDNINLIFAQLGWNPILFTRIALPLGVSFVVFQKMTYCLDIAKGISQPTNNFFYLLEYLLIFPQIVAGPIVKYNEISDQIQQRNITRDSFSNGFNRFAIGLFKKVWIADVVARIADSVFEAHALGGVPLDYAWLGIIAYTFQIYFDFSAYSDMAIGMLAMMGFHIQENFNKPYTALSVTDFWKRWRISMTSWFREYLYFPLGGNRKGPVRTYINQWIVFLVSGFWHGASWNFIFWGGYHGTLLCAERSFLLKRIQRIPRWIRWGVTLFVVMIGWIFFRVENIKLAVNYIGALFDFNNYFTHVNPSYILVIDAREWFILGLAAAISFLPLFSGLYGRLTRKARQHPTWVATGSLLLFALAALKVITGSISPFIYFRF